MTAFAETPTNQGPGFTERDPLYVALDRMEDVLSRVRYKDWLFYAGRSLPDGGLYLQVRFMAGDQPQHVRKWLLSSHMTNSEVVQTAMMAVLAAEEHEARELFKLNGVAVLAPHFNLTQLAELVNAGLLETDARH